MSSHFRVRRIITLALLGLFLLSLYLTTSCWPVIPNLFGHRRYVLGELGHRTRSSQTCLFASDSGDKSSDHPRHRGASLLVRPLKHSDESFSVLELTLDKVKSLIKQNNKSASDERTNNNNCTENDVFWRLHRKESQQDRLERLQYYCRLYDFVGRIFTFRSSTSNRRPERHSTVRFCSTRTCPLLVSEKHKTLTCFVQKVGSTTLKQIFLRLEQANESVSQVTNLTTFHLNANEKLFRISPIYIRHSKESSYFKAIFVRHPFVRLVSAFKDKAERGPDQEPYFYAQYFNPLFDRLYGTGKWNESTRITFKQFVEELLLKTDPYLYDEHWSPIWTRCEPCFVHYDFIGKLESSEADFKAFKGQVDKSLLNQTIWENPNRQFGSATALHYSAGQAEEEKCRSEHFKYAETRRYLEQLTAESIIELYKRYYLDFELYGYTIDELFL